MARTNRFKVEFHGPHGINSRGIRCTNVTLPGRSIQTENYKTQFSGPPRAHPSFVDYGGNVQLTFMLDSTFEDHEKISMWNHEVYDEAWGFRYPVSSKNSIVDGWSEIELEASGISRYLEGYEGQVIITQLDKQDWPIYEVVLHEAWPSAFSEISLDSTSDSGIQTFNCTFQYRTWTSEYKNSGSGLLGGLFKKVSRKIGSDITSKIEGKIFK